MKGGETVSLRKDKWVKQSSADWDVNLWAVDLCAVGVMKMLTVLISEAGGVECLAAGVDGSESSSTECASISCCLCYPTGKELSEPL